MLDIQDEEGRARLVYAISQLKSEVNLPAAWSECPADSGKTEGYTFQRRQFARRRHLVLAGLLCQETFSLIPRSRQWHPVYLQNLSRGGAAFFHCEQLYPLEQMRLLFIDEVSARLLQTRDLRAVEVVRCKRVHDKCYEVGVRFLNV